MAEVFGIFEPRPGRINDAFSRGLALHGATGPVTLVRRATSSGSVDVAEKSLNRHDNRSGSVQAGLAHDAESVHSSVKHCAAHIIIQECPAMTQLVIMTDGHESSCARRSTVCDLESRFELLSAVFISRNPSGFHELATKESYTDEPVLSSSRNVGCMFRSSWALVRPRAAIRPENPCYASRSLRPSPSREGVL